MNILKMADLDLAGKRVFIRADLNVPQDDAGNITEDTRIRASVPGIRLALDKGAAVMVTSHLGRPKEGEFRPEDTLAPVARRLSELLEQPVRLVQNWVDGDFQGEARPQTGIRVGFLPQEPALDAANGTQKNREQLTQISVGSCWWKERRKMRANNWASRRNGRSGSRISPTPCGVPWRSRSAARSSSTSSSSGSPATPPPTALPRVIFCARGC